MHTIRYKNILITCHGNGSASAALQGYQSLHFVSPHAAKLAITKEQKRQTRARKAMEANQAANQAAPATTPPAP
jgi:hypothetical protein